MAIQKFKNKVRVEAEIEISQSTANRALITNADKEIVASPVTDTELGHLTGVTSNVQDQIDAAQADATQALSDIANHIADTTDAHDASAISNVPSGNLAATDVQGALNELQSDVDSRIPSAEKGAANGVATLDANGKVPVAQLPNAIMEYQGVWDASTNTPTLANGAGNADSDIGNVYRVSVAGTVDFGAGNITFAVGDYAILNSSKIWEKADTTDAVSSVFGRTGAVTAQSGDYTASQITNTPAGGIAATDVQAAINELDSDKANVVHTHVAADITDFTEAAQDAVAGALTDSSSIDFTYDDSLNTITAQVLPAGVDHDQLQNFVANEHVDHSTVQIQTAANSGLSGGGDITASRSLVVDITGTTAETVADDADEILIWDSSANARRKMTRANFLAGISAGSAGDIEETSFALANNQTTPANVTGLAFANAVVRSFKALVSVEIDATTDSFEAFELLGIQKGSGWDMTVSSTGDDSGVVFSITSAGQIQYTSTNNAGFVAGAIKFIAKTTSI